MSLEGLDCKADKVSLTVGDHVSLLCSGNLGDSFLAGQAVFKTAPSNPYHLKLFKIQKNESAGHSIDMTIYTAGQFKISDFIVTDGVNEIKLNGAELKVESVLKPTEDGKPPEPYGAIFPINMSTPFFYYVALISAIILVCIYSVYRLRRVSYYKKLKNRLAQYSSPVEPDTQFYKAIRIAEKSEYPVDLIEKAFRLYNLRTYQLPMFDLTNEKINKYFRRNFPEHKSARIELLKVLNEIDVIKSRDKSLTFNEKKEFIKKLYRYVEINRGILS